MKVSSAFCGSLLLGASIIVASVTSYGAPAPDPKGAQYQGKGEQDRSYEFPGTGVTITSGSFTDGFHFAGT